MHAYYGKSHISQGVTMNVQEGEIVALLGRNGVGRSSTCKAIMGDPDFVMIDEPTEGLSPQMVQKVAEVLKEIAARGISTLLVEQKLSIAMDIAHRVYVMGHGRVVFEGTPAALKERIDVRKEWLEV